MRSEHELQAFLLRTSGARNTVHGVTSSHQVTGLNAAGNAMSLLSILVQLQRFVALSNP